MNTQTYQALKAQLLPEASQIAHSHRLDTLSFNTRTERWSLMLVYDTPGNRDVAKAKIFAGKEGYTVFCYQGERDPLGKAKQDILKTAS